MKIALIDLETSGLDPQLHEILEIGCLVIDSDTFEIIDQYETKVRPEHIDTAHPKALEVNGYNEADWVGAETLENAIGQLSFKIKDTTMMAFNISFDWSFLQAAFRKTNTIDPMSHHRLDLLTLAWSKIPRSKVSNYSLKTVCAYLHIPPEPKVHRAMNGTMAAHEVYKKLCSS